jgi:hypothetical protein
MAVDAVAGALYRQTRHHAETQLRLPLPGAQHPVECIEQAGHASRLAPCLHTPARLPVAQFRVRHRNTTLIAASVRHEILQVPHADPTGEIVALAAAPRDEVDVIQKRILTDEISSG